MRECAHCARPILEGQRWFCIGVYVTRRGEKSGNLFDEPQENIPTVVHAVCAPKFVSPAENDAIYDAMWDEMFPQVWDQHHQDLQERIMKDIYQKMVRGECINCGTGGTPGMCLNCWEAYSQD